MTPLAPLELLEPVELLTAPVLPELVALPVPVSEPVDSSELDELSELPLEVAESSEAPELVVVVAAVEVVAVLRASAGSWPVMSTTAISDHTAMNNATEPPITRARIVRTRARRASLILMPSSLVMGPGSDRCVAAACEVRKNLLSRLTPIIMLTGDSNQTGRRWQPNSNLGSNRAQSAGDRPAPGE